MFFTPYLLPLQNEFKCTILAKMLQISLRTLQRRMVKFEVDR